MPRLRGWQRQGQLLPEYMGKKTALVMLITNSFLIPDPEKKKLLDKLDNLTEEQIMALGKLLAIEREEMVKNRDQILKSSRMILQAAVEAAGLGK